MDVFLGLYIEQFAYHVALYLIQQLRFLNNKHKLFQIFVHQMSFIKKVNISIINITGIPSVANVLGPTS
jgi:hypothetical protein